MPNVITFYVSSLFPASASDINAINNGSECSNLRKCYASFTGLESGMSFYDIIYTQVCEFMPCKRVSARISYVAHRINADGNAYIILPRLVMATNMLFSVIDVYEEILPRLIRHPDGHHTYLIIVYPVFN